MGGGVAVHVLEPKMRTYIHALVNKALQVTQKL